MPWGTDAKELRRPETRVPRPTGETGKSGTSKSTFHADEDWAGSTAAQNKGDKEYTATPQTE